MNKSHQLNYNAQLLRKIHSEQGCDVNIRNALTFAGSLNRSPLENHCQHCQSLLHLMMKMNI